MYVWVCVGGGGGGVCVCGGGGGGGGGGKGNLAKTTDLLIRTLYGKEKTPTYLE